jgi:hypothetical protein
MVNGDGCGVDVVVVAARAGGAGAARQEGAVERGEHLHITICIVEKESSSSYRLNN